MDSRNASEASRKGRRVQCAERGGKEFSVQSSEKGGRICIPIIVIVIVILIVISLLFPNS